MALLAVHECTTQSMLSKEEGREPLTEEQRMNSSFCLHKVIKSLALSVNAVQRCATGD